MTPLEVLRQVELFQNLTDEQLRRLVGICEERQYRRDSLVFEEDSEGDEMYIIENGLVEIQINPALLGVKAGTPPAPTTIAVLRPGQIFGEVGLVDEGRRSASAKCAADDTKLLVLNRAEFIALCEEDFSLGYRVMRNIAMDLAYKIRHTDMMVREQLLWKRSLEYPLQSRIGKDSKRETRKS